MSDINHISERVDQDRARLARSLDTLTDIVKPQKMAEDLTTAATDIGGDIANKAWGTLRDNPAGGLLVTIGLGLLASGQQRRSAPPPQPSATAVDPETAMAGFDARVQQADADMRAAHHPEASRLKAALTSGLDHLPTKAQKRVIDARKAALAAQEKVERQAKRATRKAKGFAYEQPLTVGALALGFGVLAGTLLPGTRREDALLGKRRDALMANARHALQDEMQKAKMQAEQAIARKTGT